MRVAGTKLIFIVLIIGVLIAGTPEIKVYGCIALVFSIMTFYSRLYPALKRMDTEGLLAPKDYSRTLAIMIGGSILVFAVAVFAFILRRENSRARLSRRRPATGYDAKAYFDFRLDNFLNGLRGILY